MGIIIFIITYLVGAFITYIAYYCYLAYVYSKSKELQSKFCFVEYMEESWVLSVVISCFWMFVLILAPIGFAIYYLTKHIQNVIKKKFNIK